jgi:O-antigen/teichoic acid export membrane protein
LKTEAARGILRIISNYARLGGNLILGLVLVAFMLGWIRNDAVAVVSLLGAGSGFAAMFREITVRAVIRELASAHHSDDRDHFRTIFNSALLISSAAGGVVLIGFAILFYLVHSHFFDIGPALMPAAYALLLTQGIVAIYSTAVAPLFNMQVVTERFVLYNFWTLADRATFLAAAVFVRYVLRINDPAEALIKWSVITAILELGAITAPMVVLMVKDPLLRPNPFRATRAGAMTVFSTLRWYVAVEAGANMYDRAGIIFSNRAIGIQGNLVYGLGQQFVNYISQVAFGISQGLDSISARLESKSERSLPVLVYHSTRLLALASLPVGLVFFVLAPQLIQIWVGKKIENPTVTVPQIALTVQIMTLAITIRAISQGWVSILYGAGYLRRYAPLLLLGGICNVVLTTLALLAFRGASDEWKQCLIPGVMVVVNSTVYGVFLPRVAAKCLQVRYRDMYAPLMWPLVATTLCSPLLLVAPWAFARLGLSWNLATVAALGVSFGGLYALVSAGLVLQSHERERFLWSPLRRLLPTSPKPEPPRQ